MLTKERALHLSVIVLFLAATMDMVRGYMHTFQVKYAATHLAGIEPISDSLVLMSSFGISNFLTGFMYYLVIWKARHLAPYILLLIPISYVLGGLGMRYQNIQMESPFVGQYMMAKYLAICLITSLIYFVAQKKKSEKPQKQVIPEVKELLIE